MDMEHTEHWEGGAWDPTANVTDHNGRGTQDLTGVWCRSLLCCGSGVRNYLEPLGTLYYLPQCDLINERRHFGTQATKLLLLGLIPVILGT